MKTRASDLLLFVLVAVALLIGAVDYYRREATRRGWELQRTIAHMPTGITTAEADRILGTVPDRVVPVSGVLISNVTMLDARNSKAAAYGPLQPYLCRMWTQGNVTATVAIDNKGRVAGRWAPRPK